MKRIFLFWITLSFLFALCSVVVWMDHTEWTTASILKIAVPSLFYMFLPSVVIGLILELIQHQRQSA